MENRNLDIKKIKAFLNSELSLAETEAFTEAIQRDPDLEKEVKTQYLIQQSISLLLKEEASSKNKATIAEVVPQRKLLRIIKTRVLPIAASFALFIIPLSKVLKYTNESIHSRYYTVDEDLTSNLMGAKNKKTIIKQAEVAYLNKNYSETINILTNISNNNKATYLLAHAYYQMADYSNAILQFKKVSSTKNPKFEKKAEWYQLLSYLKNDDIGTEFYSLVEKIIDEKGIYADNALAIKLDLDNSWRRIQ